MNRTLKQALMLHLIAVGYRLQKAQEENPKGPDIETQRLIEQNNESKDRLAQDLA